MDTREAYNRWAFQYDTNENKTRDLEAQALRNTLANIPFHSILEIGCGTGKNTEWLLQQAQMVTAVDLSDEMLIKARQKFSGASVQFIQWDINNDWSFTEQNFDLVSFSLVLEHIENLDHVFKEAVKKLKNGGYVYIGELHPFKQYSGSKARFETGEGVQVLNCFTHHLSDYLHAAKKYGLIPVDIDEYFDDIEQTSIPRILVLLFKKSVEL